MTLPDGVIRGFRAAIAQADDHELNRLVAIIKDRRQDIEREKFRELRVGMRVRLTGNVKPSYLRGQTGEIVDVKLTRYVVNLDRGSIGRYSGQLRCPASILEALPEAATTVAERINSHRQLRNGVRELPDGGVSIDLTKVGYNCASCGAQVPAGTEYLNYMAFEPPVRTPGFPDMGGTRLAVCYTCWDGVDR
jgi:hypothetical protein